MYKITLLLLTALVAEIYGQTDYCSLSCYNGAQQTVCARKDVQCGEGPACESKFEVIELTKEYKQMIVDVHNELRNKVATGNEKTYQPQPSASNMFALSYNEELATIAQCWANSCEFDHDACRRTAEWEHVGQNLGIRKGSNPVKDAVAFMNDTMYAWYDEVKDVDPSTVSSYKKPASGAVIGHYTQLVWAETMEIGCALSSFFAKKKYQIYFVCNYGFGGNILDEPIYKTGEPATQCFKPLSWEELAQAYYDYDEEDGAESEPPKGEEVPKNDKYAGLCGPSTLA